LIVFFLTPRFSTFPFIFLPYFLYSPTCPTIPFPLLSFFNYFIFCLSLQPYSSPLIITVFLCVSPHPTLPPISINDNPLNDEDIQLTSTSTIPVCRYWKCITGIRKRKLSLWGSLSLFSFRNWLVGGRGVERSFLSYSNHVGWFYVSK